MNSMSIIVFSHITYKLYEILFRVDLPLVLYSLELSKQMVKGPGNEKGEELLFNSQSTNRISDN